MLFIGDDDEIPMRERDNYRNAIKFAFTAEFQSGIETIGGSAI